MSLHAISLVLSFTLVMLSVRAEEHYPLSWSQVDYKPVIDNTRLFRKYKDCLIADKPVGCPRDVTEFKNIILEGVRTSCAKCLPQHMTRLKEGLEYICKTRRSDFDEVRKLKDPAGELQGKFEKKYGKLNC